MSWAPYILASFSLTSSDMKEVLRNTSSFDSDFLVCLWPRQLRLKPLLDLTEQFVRQHTRQPTHIFKVRAESSGKELQVLASLIR